MPYSDSVSHGHLADASCAIPGGRCQEGTHRRSVSNQMTGGGAEPWADLQPQKAKGTLAKLAREIVFNLLVDMTHSHSRQIHRTTRTLEICQQRMVTSER